MNFGTVLLAAATSGTNQFVLQMLILVAFIGLMYFLLIRPQKKKEKQVNEMRNSVRVGDEIVTIGGIVGKIVKTKDESLIIEVGADKVKFEVMRWSISSVTSKGKGASGKAADTDTDMAEDEQPKKRSPRRLKKATTEETAEESKNPFEESK